MCLAIDEWRLLLLPIVFDFDDIDDVFAVRSMEKQMMI
jgi:hypothetical protein